MTDTKELNDLIARAEQAGATVTVTWIEEDGWRLHDSIQVSGLKGIGPYPMGPIAAAEALRQALR